MKQLYTLLIAGLCTYQTAQAKDYIKYKDASVQVSERVEDLMARMTLDEKVAQLMQMGSHMIVHDGKVDLGKMKAICQKNGIGFFEGITLTSEEAHRIMSEVQHYMIDSTRLGIPVFTITESLHGSVNDGATIYPQAIALGSTFNPELVYQMTANISEELKVQGITQSLTPVVDVCRDLRWGRVEECFGEDPFLVRTMGAHQVKGYMDQGISPMLKHFGAHGSPSGGLNLASVHCGQRDLLSIYLQPFEYIVKTVKPWAVMSSYNSWNGVPNSASEYLMTNLLRDEWGFQGYVYSDWGSIDMLDYFHKTARNRAEAAYQAFHAGLDVEAGINCYQNLKGLVASGLLDMEDIDRAVRRVLTAKFEMGLFEYRFPTEKEFKKHLHTPKQVALARKLAEESIVLLQNNEKLLPLDIHKLQSVALIGPNAHQVQFGDYTWSRSNEDGVTLLEAFRKRAGNKIRIEYAKGCDLHTDTTSYIPQAVNMAKNCDLSIVVVGSASASLSRDYSNVTCGEGYDLSDMTLTGAQEELIKAIHATGKPVIVVLLSGKPFAMPWVKENIPTILVQWYPGEQGGNALYDVLFGEVNPSGKLNYSFPKSTGNMPCYYNHLPTDRGFYHQPGKPNQPGRDYVFDTPEPLWAFGHGLSYSEFEYCDMQTDKEEYDMDDTIHIDVKVRNLSDIPGKEVVQVYVRDLISSVVTPIQELKAFSKVNISGKETKQVNLSIPVHDLGLYNQAMKYVVEPGEFEIQVGGASDKIALRKKIGVALHEEKKINLEKQENTTRKIKKEKITVSGYVRDVQANPVENVRIESEGQSVSTDADGFYQITTYSTATLLVKGQHIESKKIPVQGEANINIEIVRKK